MAIDPWILDASGGAPSYSGQDARLALGAAFVRTTNALGVRSGVLPNGGLTALWTTAQGTPNMTVNVAVGQAVVQGSTTTTQGPYVYTLDVAKTVTITAAHATLPRIDVVAVRVRDSNVSGTGLDGDIVAIAGTAASSPAVPGFPADGASYLALANISVPAAATNIASGQITNQWQWTTTEGGSLLVETKAKLDAITTLPMGQLAYVWVDKTHWAWNGTVWKRLMTEDEVGLGIVAYTQATSGTGTTTSGGVKDTGLTLTFTFKAGRRYWVRCMGNAVAGTGAAVARYLIVNHTGTDTGTTIAGLEPGWVNVTAGQGMRMTTVEGYYEPGVSDVTMTIKTQIQGSGSSTGSTTPARHSLTVIDIGKV